MQVLDGLLNGKEHYKTSLNLTMKSNSHDITDPLSIQKGDLVWHEDYFVKEMGLVYGFDPDVDVRCGDDYAWIFITTGPHAGQKKWTRIKYLRKCVKDECG